MRPIGSILSDAETVYATSASYEVEPQPCLDGVQWNRTLGTSFALKETYCFQGVA